MMSIETGFLMTACPFLSQPYAWDAVSNTSKYNILAGTQLIIIVSLNHCFPLFNTWLCYIVEF